MDLGGFLVILFREGCGEKNIQLKVIGKDHELVHSHDGDVFLHGLKSVVFGQAEADLAVVLEYCLEILLVAVVLLGQL